jgi:hypothetical protein
VPAEVEVTAEKTDLAGDRRQAGLLEAPAAEDRSQRRWAVAKKVTFAPTSFNFGANKRPRRAKGKKGGGKKSNAWRAYVGGGARSNAPIPD